MHRTMESNLFEQAACYRTANWQRHPAPLRPTRRKHVRVEKEEKMADNLQGKRIAILATDGFEQAELMEPRKALDEAGATTVVIAPKAGEIKGWKMKDWGDSVKVDKTVADANPNDYEALVLPGGVINPDHL